MFRKTTVLISLVLLLSTYLLAMELPQEKMEFELVQEREFDKEIKDVAWGETEDGRLYPKIIVFEDEVRFYDEEGNKLKVVSSSWPDVAISPRADCIGIKKTTERYEKGGGISEWTIHTETGKEVWKGEYEAKDEFEALHMYAISDEVHFVMGNSTDHILEFLNRKGERLREVDVFENDEWDPDRALSVAFSKNGEYLAVLATETFVMDVRETYYSEEERQGPYVYVILFDKTGTELWRKPFSENWARHISWSPDGNYIIAYGHSSAGQRPTTYTQALFNRNAELLGEYHVRMHDGSYDFSENGESLVLGGENEIQLVQTLTGEVMWTQEFPWLIDSMQQEWKWVKSVGVADDGTIIVLSICYERYRNPDGSGGYVEAETEVMLFNRNGELLSQENIEGAKFLEISPQGTEMFVTRETSLGKIIIR